MADPINLLLSNMPYKYGFTKKYRDRRVLGEFITDQIMLMYNKRYQKIDSKSDKKRNINLFDLLVKHNIQHKGNKEEEVPAEQIVGNITGILFASFDTSLQASTTALTWMNYKYTDWL